MNCSRTLQKTFFMLSLCAMLMSCALFQPAANTTPEQSTRIALYTLNQSWIEIRTYMMSQYLQDGITEQQLNEFKTLDDSFSLYYNLAVGIFLSSADASIANPELDSALTTLRNLVLQARSTYYAPANKEEK